ncbi:STAS/SEC14 domain-containing protein [Mycolicibacterium mucogenicum]|uniref:STAS/SEC14 domain-containing protein n=1 Tax=Mycolicibacterium mucogenicum TaxID=56689 RepID=UPI00235026FF|nr:STAS/SEC14 domain-containing protein [Mycolicibacterium mucogenicum]
MPRPTAKDWTVIDQQWDSDNSILTIRPESPLSTGDFAALAHTVDPKIEHGDDLAGLIIDAPRFPGWDSFGAMVTHLRFVHDHHQHVKKVAVVTDSPMAGIAQHLVAHFIAAEIRPFPEGRVEDARAWITGGGQAEDPRP